jgi:hypothetical protein
LIFSDVEYFFPRIAPPVSILLLLYVKKNNTKNIDDTSLLIQKYEIIITKYLNIAIAEHAHVLVVENGECNTSHSKRVEQAFYTKYTGKV